MDNLNFDYCFALAFNICMNLFLCHGLFMEKAIYDFTGQYGVLPKHFKEQYRAMGLGQRGLTFRRLHARVTKALSLITFVLCQHPGC